MKRLAIGLLIVAGVFVVVMLVGYGVTATWYADDACPKGRAQWKCDVGALGLAAMLGGAALAALSGLAAAVAWGP